MQTKPTPKKGLARIGAAFFYSLAGVRHAIRHEAAFRQEFILFIVVAIVLIFLPFSIPWKAALLAANTMVMIVELLNSAMEKVVDMVSPEYNPLAKQAKDMGSAAVLLCLLLTTGLWLTAFSVAYTY